MMGEILLGISVFTGLVMVLAIIVLAARAVIWGKSHATINVNGERIFESALGEKLLGALHHGGVHLPTSCGGVGTCGLCRVLVSGPGAEDPLPIERASINVNDIADGYRLACQMVVRDDLNVTVPQGLLVAKSWLCTVLSTHTLSPLIKEIVFDLPAGDEQTFAAGSYALVNSPPFKLSFSDIVVQPKHESAWNRLRLRHLNVESTENLDRAYSLVNRMSETSILKLNVRLVLPPASQPSAPPGVVSSYLFGLKVGDTVQLSGPYGNFFVQDTDREMIFIGGGVGMAPLYAHIFDQLDRLKTNRKISYWYGARSVDDLYYADDMDALAREHDNFSWHVALSEPTPEDDWQGEKGFVHTVVFDQYLRTHPSPKNCEYYLCGPPLMIHAVRNTLDKLGVPSENVFSDDFGV